MIVQNIWGLLLLLSIPLLVVIYVIKQEHKERSVSSTYLWHLSERFLKKRMPIKRLSGLLAFLLQLAILALLALSATQPAVRMGQIFGHIVVIDASASMQTEQDGVTRFEAAVAETKKLAKSGLCSSMTIIFASDTPSCPVMGGSAQEALYALDEAVCGYGGCDLYETMNLVREAYARMGSAKVTFYTDTEYADVENVEVVDMRRGEKNVAVTGLTHTADRFTGTLVSYGEDREVTVGLFIDGKIADTRTVSCVNGVPATVVFDSDVSSFKEATLRFDLEDALEADNSYSVMGKRAETVSVLVTGTETLFFETGFAALGNCDVTVKESYDTADDGAYDLYIFSGNVPKGDSFPKKGMSIGFAQANAVDDRHYEGTLLGTLNVRMRWVFDEGLVPKYMKMMEIDPLMEGLETAMADVYVRAALACHEMDNYYYYNSTRGDYLASISSSGYQWAPVCGFAKYGGSAIAACGRVLGNGSRQYLFMFPLSESNLAMTPAFMILLENACRLASAPSIPQTCYAVGEAVEITLKHNAEDALVVQPDGTKIDLLRQKTSFIPTQPGIHTLTYDHNKQSREASFFVHIAAEEYETYRAESIYLSKTAERSEAGELLYDPMLPLMAVILSALLIFEWGYHYRGKY